jgi:hypothetical protein
MKTPALLQVRCERKSKKKKKKESTNKQTKQVYIYIYIEREREREREIDPHLRLGFPSGLILFMSPHQNFTTISVLPMRAICPPHLLLLTLITLIIFSNKHRPRNS